MKITPKFYGLLFGLLMAGMMSLTMSFALLALNMGFNPNFVSIWLNNALIGFYHRLPNSTVGCARLPVV